MDFNDMFQQNTVNNSDNQLQEILSGMRDIFKKNEQRTSHEHTDFLNKVLSFGDKTNKALDETNKKLKTLFNNQNKYTESEFNNHAKFYKGIKDKTLKEYDLRNKNFKSIASHLENYNKKINNAFEKLSTQNPFKKLSTVLEGLTAAQIQTGKALNKDQSNQLSNVFKGTIELFTKNFEKTSDKQNKKLVEDVINARQGKNEARKTKNEARKKDSWLFNFEGKLEDTVLKATNKAGGYVAGKTGSMFDKMSGIKGLGGIGKSLSNAADIVKTDFETANEDIELKEEKNKLEANKDISQKDTDIDNAKIALTKNDDYQAQIKDSLTEFKLAQTDYQKFMESTQGENESDETYSLKRDEIFKSLVESETKLQNLLDNMRENDLSRVADIQENNELLSSGVNTDISALQEYQKLAENDANRLDSNLSHILDNIIQKENDQSSLNNLSDFIQNDGISTQLSNSFIESYEFLKTNVLDNYFSEIINGINTIIGNFTPFNSFNETNDGFKLHNYDNDGTVIDDGPIQLNDGGLIPGNNTEGDKVPALVNSGEMVLNKDQQANLFNMIGAQHFEDGGIAGTGPIKSQEQLEQLSTYEQEYTTIYQENAQQRMETDQRVLDFKTNLQQVELQNKEQANQQEIAMTNKMTMMEKAAALKEKAIMVGQAIATTASSVGKAFAIGQVDPFAINASIQAGIAAVMGATQIASIMGVGFEQGGVVPGESYKGDKVIARVNSGELILNTSQQENLLKAINNAEQFASGGVAGGGDSSKILDVASKGQDASKQSFEQMDKMVIFQQDTIQELKNVINTIKENKPTLVTRMPGKSFPSVRYSLDYSNY